MNPLEKDYNRVPGLTDYIPVVILIPYSTALTLAKPPWATYAIVFLCVLIFYFQLTSSITDSLAYYPDSWNPFTMITASLAHSGWMHLSGNLIIFMAFAPALEAIIGNTVRYILLMLFLALVTGVSYSISTLIGYSDPLPTIGLSGIVMGMIGLSAYIMPQAKIKVFWWYIFFWKTFYVPSWIVALVYISLDCWQMLTNGQNAGINVVAHVSGGFAGYGFGLLWLKDRKEEIQEELDTEIEQMKFEQKHGKSPSMSYRRSKTIQQQKVDREKQRQHDHFLGRVYKAVSTHRDSDAVLLILDYYDTLQTPVSQFEELFSYMQQWGPSRTQLCIGRLIIQTLHQDRRYGRALFFIEQCQQISPQFILADLSQTLYFARLALQTNKIEVSRNLLIDAEKRYGQQVDIDLCNQLIAQIKLS